MGQLQGLARRPLLLAAVAAIGGITAVAAFWPSLRASLLWCLAFAILLAAALAWPRARRTRWVPLGLGMLLLAGVAAFWLTWRMAPNTAPELEAILPEGVRAARVVGVIAGDPDTVSYPLRMGSYQRTRFLLDVSEVDGVPWQGVIQVYLDSAIGGLACGDEVAITGRLRRPGAPTNPGEFDYARHLRLNGISGSIAVNRADACRPTGRSFGSNLVSAGRAFKERCMDAADRQLPESQATILKCLLMGRTSDLEAEQQTAFRETGTLHLLAISGTHIVMVAGFVWLLLMAAGLGPRATAVGVILAVTGYALLAGLGPSVQRATIACIVVCGAYLFMRKPDLPTSMALALLVVLALNPADLFNAGMQLSFAAVAGIYLFTLPIERALFGPPDELERLQDAAERSTALHWLRDAIRRSLSLSLAASLATVPLMAYHFEVFTPLAPVATLLLTPAVTLAMAAGLPAVLLGAFCAPAAWPLFKLAGFGVWLMDEMARAMAQLPGVAQYGPSPGFWLTLAACAVLPCIALWPEQLWRPWRAVGLLLLPAALYLGLVWHQPPPAFVELHMLSVGEAHCSVVRFPDGRNLLFDAGGPNMRSGAKILAPALWAVGVRQIDLALLSHSDEDHCTGFEELARRIPVGCLALPAHFEDNGKTREWVERLGRSFRILRVARGDRVEGFPLARLNVLWPPRETFFARGTTPNFRSAVLDVRTDQGRILFTGDLNGAAGAILSDEEPDLRARIAQVPHHGRLDDSSEPLAKAISPELALVPGSHDRPSPWLAHSKRLLATEQCGMISVRLTPGRLDVRTFCEPSDENAGDTILSSAREASHNETVSFSDESFVSPSTEEEP